MKNTIITLAGIISLASVSTFSHADDFKKDVAEHGIYVGGNYGYLKVDGEDDFDDNNDVLQGIVGYRFNNYLALEGMVIPLA